MHELTVTPSGQIRIRESQNEHVDSDRLKGLVEAYQQSVAQGMLQSATDSMGGELPASFEFVRSVARLYLTNLSKSALAEMGHEIGDLPPPVAELERLILQAPPMIGLEYVTSEVLSNWWNQLDTLTRKEIKSHSGGAEGFLKDRIPQWRSVGRVTFHLAENKRNTQYPFAFLATYASGLTAQGKVKHEPLGGPFSNMRATRTARKCWRFYYLFLKPPNPLILYENWWIVRKSITRLPGHPERLMDS